VTPNSRQLAWYFQGIFKAFSRHFQGITIWHSILIASEFVNLAVAAPGNLVSIVYSPCASTPPHPLIHTPRHTLMAGRTILGPTAGKRASTCVLSRSNQSALLPSPAAAHSPPSEKQSRLTWRTTRTTLGTHLTTLAPGMASMPRPPPFVLTPAMQKLAASFVSLVTRRIVRDNPRCGKFPGISWVNSDEKYRLTLIDKHANDFRTLLAPYRDFDHVPVRSLTCMKFENIVCMDLEQLANNVRIPMLVTIHWFHPANSFLVFELKQKETDYLFD
jgi:hypothetical protein